MRILAARVIHVAMSRHVMHRALPLSKKYRQMNSLKCTVTPNFFFKKSLPLLPGSLHNVQKQNKNSEREKF